MTRYCFDCRGSIGQRHANQCREEYCQQHGHLLYGIEDVERHANNCIPGVFNGASLGEVEAATRNWWAVVTGTKEVQCDPWERKAYPDANRVIRELEWDPIIGAFHEPHHRYRMNRTTHLRELERESSFLPETTAEQDTHDE